MDGILMGIGLKDSYWGRNCRMEEENLFKIGHWKICTHLKSVYNNNNNNEGTTVNWP